jgi:pimeloyl-ACP methyl ester carboxylesterase
LPRLARAKRPTGRRRGGVALALGLLLVANALSACAVGPSTRPPVAVRGPSTQDGAPAPQQPPPLPIAPQVPVPDVGDAAAALFIDCTDDMQQVLPVPVPTDRALRYECTDIPVGSNEPDGLGRQRQSSIGLMRVTLTDQSPDARPPLLILGDSDGETGTLRAARLAAQVPLSVLQHFSIVGMDRRGQGTSRLDCVPPELRDELVDTSVTAGNLAGVDQLLEDIRKGVQECNLSEGEVLTRYDTATTAQDVEQARVLLGVHTLSAIGIGDGAKALTVWAQTFPASVGRLVLDSPPDPTLNSIATAEARAGAAEAAYASFGNACESRPNCPLGPDPKATLIALTTQLQAQPLVGADGDPLTPAAALNAVLVGLDDPGSWPQLASAIGAARTGDANGLLRYLDQLLGLNGRFDLAMATHCNDTTQRVSPPQVNQLIGQWGAAHPLFGPLMAQRLLSCAAWPVPTTPAQLNPSNPTPPMLVLASATSPREPLQGYQRAAGQLPSAMLVNWQGAGQGVYPRTPCVADSVNGFLENGTMPGASVLCPP